MSRILPPPLCVLLLLALLLPSCSSSKPKRYKVTGRLTSGGKPLKTPAMVGMIQVIFYPAPDGPRPADPAGAGIHPIYAPVDASGAFVVHDGLPAGKYIVAVRQLDAGPSGADTLKDRFSFKNTKIVEEISGDRSLDIELDRYK